IKYYSYDALNQLIEVNENNRDIRKYFYDTLGNRVRLEEWKGKEIKEAINYEYGRGNRLISTYEDYIFIGDSKDYEEYITQGVEVFSKEDSKSYKYDNRGNLIEVKSGGKIFGKYE
ncbi:hypothetical protein, partial [Stenotrophomonas maltophilia group sp. RNC7]|uniref:hypothetical protein n=1 Tax=Stenotrophomonas maltophilia group sp. RNC7 TaxID=3071467 RepID=UPI0027DFD819